jgi:propanediol dehydratase large subunit/glycerol dehydratase large subunit
VDLRSKRFEALSKKPVNQDGFVKEWPEVGMIAMDGPNDPKPSIRIVNGEVVELDSKGKADFDMLDTFISKYAIKLDRAEEVCAMDSQKLAKMLCDVNVPREEIIDLTTSMTPAKICQVMSYMNVLEMMMALQKMRARKTPSNQCHVTNLRDNPVLIAADAAEASLRGFDEMETTVGVARYAPFNALSILIGAQVGRPGVLTQCAVEEATELEIGMRGLTNYAETVSVYGTEPVFIDGDDTPWSKSFLASAYASRGLKMRYTSGTGSEVLMGYAEGKSMLYLEARCVFMTKGAGVQGLQNGSISCIGVPAAVPSGIRAVLAENLITSCLDLEVASGNDQTFSHSDMRRTTRLLMQLLPGTDFITSGFSSVPNYDNMFAGSNVDAEDMDDFLVIQRDLMIEGGLRPITEDEAIFVRSKAARALQAIFREMGLTVVTDEEVEAATYAHGSNDMPQRDVVADLKAAADMMARGTTGLDVAKALAKTGFEDVAQNVLNMLKQRISGDYLHTSAILDREFRTISAVNDVNDYAGPGTGYRLSEKRWEEIKNIPNAIDPQSI